MSSHPPPPSFFAHSSIIVHALLVKLLKESGQIKRACGTLAELDW